jgi:hypothetical protein
MLILTSLIYELLNCGPRTYRAGGAGISKGRMEGPYAGAGGQWQALSIG